MDHESLVIEAPKRVARDVPTMFCKDAPPERARRDMLQASSTHHESENAQAVNVLVINDGRRESL